MEHSIDLYMVGGSADTLDDGRYMCPKWNAGAAYDG
jgi:hypothetical protein